MTAGREAGPPPISRGPAPDHQTEGEDSMTDQQSRRTNQTDGGPGGIQPPYAFHTTSRAVIDWWTEWQEAEKAHKDALDRIAAEVAPWDGAEPAVVGAFGRYRFEGFKRDWGRDIPEGWKKSGRDGEWITPKVSTKAGKALVARMAEVPPTRDVRFHDGGIPGMKIDMFFGRRPAMLFSDTEVWAHFGDDWDNLERIDQGIWTVRRLSEYYAALEARREAQTDAEVAR